MEPMPTLKQLLQQLTSDQRTDLKDIIGEVSSEAHESQSYPKALTKVLRGANFTRAASSRDITEVTDENPPMDEKNNPFSMFVEKLTLEVKDRLEVPHSPNMESDSEIFKRQEAAWNDLMAELGLG
jgi:hypothetical protein